MNIQKRTEAFGCVCATTYACLFGIAAYYTVVTKEDDVAILYVICVYVYESSVLLYCYDGVVCAMARQ